MVYTLNKAMPTTKLEIQPGFTDSQLSVRAATGVINYAVIHEKIGSNHEAVISAPPFAGVSGRQVFDQLLDAEDFSRPDGGAQGSKLTIAQPDVLQSFISEEIGEE